MAKYNSSWNKGLTIKTDERIKKMSNKIKETMNTPHHKQRMREQSFFQSKINPNYGMKGKYHSKETIQKISESRKGKPCWNKGKTGIYSEETLNKIKKARALQKVPFIDSSIEIKIQNFLKQLGIEFYTHQHIKEIEHSYLCDIFIPSINLIIECDGDYWHKYPIGKELDNIRTKELIEKGFKVLRLWESEIKVMDINKFQERIKC